MAVKLSDSIAAPASVSLESYIALVERCARERLNYPIANGSAEHARILIAKLFEVAEQSVQIISGTLRQKTSDGVEIYSYEPVVERARAFLRRPNSDLKILVQRGVLDRGDSNHFMRTLIDDDYRKGTVTLVLPTVGLLGDDVAHFMVADASAYRVETGEDAKPTERGIVAFANFGDFKLARTLARHFDEITKYLSAGRHVAQRASFGPGAKFALSR